MSEGRISVWLQQIRAPFLILSVVLVLIGIATASFHGQHHWGQALMLAVAVTLAHVAVNLFNELSDFSTQIDENTRRTPFSGGSGMMQSGKTTFRRVRLVAYFSLLGAAAIGSYFIILRGWVILLFMIPGGIAIRFYTSHLTRWRIGEITAGMTLGSLVVLGSHYALTGDLPGLVIWISIPPGILTFLLLFLNEFPDMEADHRGGRQHLVIQLGRKNSSRVYVCMLVIVFLGIALTPLLFQAPATLFIAFLTLPAAVKAAVGALRFHHDMGKFIPVLAANVAVVILTDLLIAIAFLVA
jgi:1,4-dihydroxy-2-naphthoate octaprenyltransferase